MQINYALAMASTADNRLSFSHVISYSKQAILLPSVSRRRLILYYIILYY